MKNLPKPGQWWRSSNFLAKVIRKSDGIVWAEIHGKYEIKLMDFEIVYFMSAFSFDELLNNEQDIIE
jgi:hypothetical protein